MKPPIKLPRFHCVLAVHHQNYFQNGSLDRREVFGELCVVRLLNCVIEVAGCADFAATGVAEVVKGFIEVALRNRSVGVIAQASNWLRIHFRFAVENHPERDRKRQQNESENRQKLEETFQNSR